MHAQKGFPVCCQDVGVREQCESCFYQFQSLSAAVVPDCNLCAQRCTAFGFFLWQGAVDPAVNMLGGFIDAVREDEAVNQIGGMDVRGGIEGRGPCVRVRGYPM